MLRYPDGATGLPKNACAGRNLNLANRPKFYISALSPPNTAYPILLFSSIPPRRFPLPSILLYSSLSFPTLSSFPLSSSLPCLPLHLLCYPSLSYLDLSYRFLAPPLPSLSVPSLSFDSLPIHPSPLFHFLSYPLPCRPILMHHILY